MEDAHIDVEYPDDSFLTSFYLALSLHMYLSDAMVRTSIIYIYFLFIVASTYLSCVCFVPGYALDHHKLLSTSLALKI